MTPLAKSILAREVGVFTAPGDDGLEPFFAEHGFAIMRGLYSDEDLHDLEIELERQQQRLLAGELPEVCGTVVLDDPGAMIDGAPFAHYVCHVTEVSSVTRDAAYRPALVAMMTCLLGPQAWLLEDDRFGVVYQDARPGAQSGYSRIGWHTDHQSGPHLDIWPGAAFTVHFDPTSPANGFLRVLPGSHLGSTEGIPLGFERVPGEVALYLERGDVLFHHSDLWHAAARATADGDLAIRRHLRGSWHGGAKLDVGHGTADFVKNALR